MFDVRLSNRVHAHCDGYGRRDFLRIGALAPLGFSLGHLLGATSAKADDEPKRKSRAKSVVLVYLGGGLSHHDTFDLKPEAPS